MKTRSYTKTYKEFELSICVTLDERMNMIRWDIVTVNNNYINESYTYDLLSHRFTGTAIDSNASNKITIFNEEESRQYLLELLGGQWNNDIDFLLAM